MRVNMDSSIVTDPRFRLLAADLGVSFNEVVGALFAVWLACYERRSERLSKRQANAAAALSERFSDALVGAELADDLGDDVLIHGVTERIKFLEKQAERGRKGGENGKGRRKDKQPKANAKRTPNRSRSVRLTNPPALTPALTPSLSAMPTAEKLSASLLESIRRQWPNSVTGQKPQPPANWDKDMAKLLKTQTEADVAGAIDWLESGQPPGCAFVVQSAGALLEKWDRIQAMRSKPAGWKSKDTAPGLPWLEPA